MQSIRMPTRQRSTTKARRGPVVAVVDAASSVPLPSLSAACHALLAALPVPVLWIDRHGVVRACNPLAVGLLGRPLLGESWRLLVQQRFCTGAPGAGLTLTSGQPVAVTINPFDGGQLLALLVQRAAEVAHEGELRSARLVEIGKLAAGLAHQLRTPIAAAQLYLDLARETGAARYFDDTQTALDSLTRHTESLLTLARGEFQNDAELSVVELIELTVRQAQALVRGDRLVVTNDCPQARLLCNRHLLSGVILNLIENATQASPPKGVIELHCAQQGEEIVVAVKDFGCGIAPELCARLGEPLVTGRPQGTGLGLTMARLVVERHGGALVIASTPGVGTTVTVRLRQIQHLVALQQRREAVFDQHPTDRVALAHADATSLLQGFDCV